MTTDEEKRLDMVSEGLMTIPEAERITGVKKTTLYKLMNQGEIPYVKVGRARRIPRRGLFTYMARQLVVRDITGRNEKLS